MQPYYSEIQLLRKWNAPISSLLPVKSKGHHYTQKINRLIQKIPARLESDHHFSETIELLKEIESLCHPSDQNVPPILRLQELGQRVLRIERLLETQMNQRLSPKKPVIYPPLLDLVIILDFDARDHNGANTDSFIKAIESKVPIIASRSLVSGSQQSLTTSRDEVNYSIKIAHLLYQKREEWLLFELLPKEGKPAFVLFFPKHLNTHSSIQKTLSHYDLAANRLRPISLEDVLQGSPEKSRLRDLSKFIAAHPKAEKHVLLLGHGNHFSVGGLSQEQFREFYQFLRTANTVSLYVDACFAGGLFSTAYLPDREQPKEGEFEPTMLTIIRSMSDFSVGESATNLKAYFQGIHQLAGERRKSSSLSRVSKLFNGLFTSKEEDLGDVHQVLFPHNSHYKQGFRATNCVVETERLTHQKIIKRQLLSQPFRHEGGEILDFELENNVKLIEVTPLYVPVPLTLQTPLPGILSTLAGNSHHVFEDVRLIGGTLEEWIESNEKLLYKHINYDSYAHKVFFINLLNTKNCVYQSFFIQFSPEGTTWGGLVTPKKYWGCLPPKAVLYDGEKEHSCSMEQFHAERWIAYQWSRPLDKVVYAASCGKESNAQVQERLFCEPHPILEFYEGFALSPNLILTRSGRLVQKEKEAILLLALAEDQVELATKLLEKMPIEPNFSLITQGMSLLYLALFYGNEDLGHKLLDKPVNPNSPFPKKGKFPISLSLRFDLRSILKRLVEMPMIDLQVKDSFHRSLLFDALDQPALLKFLLNLPSPPPINAISKHKYTCLGAATANRQLESAKILIEHGADPSLGIPSPLIEAIYENNDKTVRFLVTKASALEPDGMGRLPLVEAARCSSLKILELLAMEVKDKINQVDGFGKTAFTAACESGNHARIRFLASLINKAPPPTKKQRNPYLIAADRNDLSLQKLLEELHIPRDVTTP